MLRTAGEPRTRRGAGEKRRQALHDVLERQHAPVEAGLAERQVGGPGLPQRERQPRRRLAQCALLHADELQCDALLLGQLAEQRGERLGVLHHAGLDVPGLAAPRLLAGPARSLLLVERGEQPGELELLEELAEPCRVGRRAVQVVEGHREVDVVAQARQLPRHARLVGLLLQGLPRSLRLDVARVLEQRVEGAPLADQLCGALLSDAPHARDVVAGVAHQRAHVEQLLGRHAEARLHLGGPVAAILHGVEQLHALAHELHQVLVGGDDGDAHRLRRARHQGRDHVVGLDAFHLQDRHAVGLDDPAHPGELGGQLLGLGVPGGLVVGVDLVAEARPARVEDDGDAGGLLFADHLAEHLREAQHRLGGDSLRGAQGRERRKEGPVDAVGSVHQHEMVVGSLAGRHGWDRKAGYGSPRRRSSGVDRDTPPA